MALLHSVPPNLQQATTGPHLQWRLPDTYGQVWVSLLWGHCSFLLVRTRFCLCPPRVCFPVLCKFWRLYGEVMKIMRTSFKRSHACTATISSPNPATGYRQPTLPLKTPANSRASLGQSLVGSLLLSLGSRQAKFLFVPPKVYFPVLCKFWQLHGGVNDDLLQEGFCHTQVCCSQSPCPVAGHADPDLHRDTQTQSVSVSVGSWVLVSTRFVGALWVSLAGWGFAMGFRDFAPPTVFCGFSFAFGCGECPQSHSSAAQPPLQCLPSSWGFSASGHGLYLQSRSNSPQLPLQTEFLKNCICRFMIFYRRQGSRPST